MKSYLTHLECTSCGATHSADQLIRLCPECDKVLYARYDLDAARRETDRDSLSGRRSDMWRYFETMPVLAEANIVSLGEGMTPILDAPRLAEAIGATNLVIKDEGQNPTGTFKSRGLAAAVSKAKELGAAGVTIPQPATPAVRSPPMPPGQAWTPTSSCPRTPSTPTRKRSPTRGHAPSRRRTDR